ncbi:hypothetical protein TMatcc_010714 [Talaromyces marneffei ATCC 18224]|uniref:LRR receptor-like serine/threonine-protein kinase FLS2 n=1 Tax=Talaromyces marneffei PM1 TaxID=1077442 RepID=A0A093VJN3_TALMA|nr:uncharacterized protein EYB26_009524 [Talaromyces marneffei]KAE8548468.1 hypothetical protein EYB25_008846 [Talaromyces marneffei]QGA21813.1 hypothetical protein EYB26_009524 [Talaromyces marneffei]
MSFNLLDNAGVAQTAHRYVTTRPEHKWYAITVNDDHLRDGETHSVGQGTSYFSLELRNIANNVRPPKEHEDTRILQSLKCTIRQIDSPNPAQTLDLQVTFGDRLGSVPVEFNKLGGTYEVNLTGRTFKVKVETSIQSPASAVIATSRRPMPTR